MKKFLFIVLLLTYGFSSSGITLQFHFCCGKLKGIAWSPEEKHRCDHGNMKNLPCCENKYFSIDGDKDYDKHPGFSTNLPFISSALHPLHALPGVKELKMVSSFSDHPPPVNSRRLFILYSVIRI